MGSTKNRIVKEVNSYKRELTSFLMQVIILHNKKICEVSTVANEGR